MEIFTIELLCLYSRMDGVHMPSGSALVRYLRGNNERGISRTPNTQHAAETSHLEHLEQASALRSIDPNAPSHGKINEKLILAAKIYILSNNSRPELVLSVVDFLHPAPNRTATVPGPIMSNNRIVPIGIVAYFSGHV